jgi:hypothetical protein
MIIGVLRERALGETRVAAAAAAGQPGRVDHAVVGEH